jgi:hypothetical protein
VVALLLGCIEWPSACARLEALVIVQNGCSVLATRSLSVGPQQALQFAFTGAGDGRHFPLRRSGLDLGACGIGLKVAVKQRPASSQRTKRSAFRTRGTATEPHPDTILLIGCRFRRVRSGSRQADRAAATFDL